MAIPLYNAEDTVRRLNGTICEYNGKPVHVRTPGDMNIVQVATFAEYQKVAPENWKRINVNDKKFSYKSLPMGYMLYNGKAVYLTRLPARQVHAGLHPDVISSSDPHFRFRDVWASRTFEDCLLGNHLRADRAINKVVNGEYESCPIHRHLAVGRLDNYKAGLYYRTRLIGILVGENRFELFNSPDSSFLERTIRNLNLGIEV